MGFGSAITTGLQKYVNFGGRASRSEFWFFVLFVFLACIAGAVLDAVLGTHGNDNAAGLFYCLAAFGLALPHLAVTVRRLHDTDRSGWWILLGFIPIVGTIILIIWFCQDGTAGPNEQGDEPLFFPTGSPGPSIFVSSRRYGTADLDRLERLSELHERGVLNSEEYEAQKADLLRKR